MALVGGFEYNVPEEMARRVNEWGGLGVMSDGLLMNQSDPNNYEHICIYNHATKTHYYLEHVIPNVGDEGLIFLSIRWHNTYKHNYAVVMRWSHNLQDGRENEFVRCKITKIDEYGYCKIDNGYNKKPGGSYTGDNFYRINSIVKVEN